jgi:hypothetical protein
MVGRGLSSLVTLILHSIGTHIMAAEVRSVMVMPRHCDEVRA